MTAEPAFWGCFRQWFLWEARKGVKMLMGTTAGGLTQDEREWIIAGMAWVGLRRWMCGAEQGEAARLWFEAQMDARFVRGAIAAQGSVRSITSDMKRLEAEYSRLAHLG